MADQFCTSSSVENTSVELRSLTAYLQNVPCLPVTVQGSRYSASHPYVWLRNSGDPHRQSRFHSPPNWRDRAETEKMPGFLQLYNLPVFQRACRPVKIAALFCGSDLSFVHIPAVRRKILRIQVRHGNRRQGSVCGLTGRILPQNIPPDYHLWNARQDIAYQEMTGSFVKIADGFQLSGNRILKSHVKIFFPADDAGISTAKSNI